MASSPSPGTTTTVKLLTTWLVADAVTRLSAEHRAVLQETYFNGRSVADAARRLGIPEGTVKSRTHYALRALRLALEEMGVVREHDAAPPAPRWDGSYVVGCALAGRAPRVREPPRRLRALLARRP